MSECEKTMKEEGQESKKQQDSSHVASAEDTTERKLARAVGFIRSLTAQKSELEKEKEEWLQQSKALVNVLEEVTHQEHLDKPAAITTPDHLKDYLQTIQSRVKQQDGQPSEPASIQHLSNGTTDDEKPAWSVETVSDCLDHILEDPEKSTLNISLPVKLLQSLEKVRKKVQTQAKSLKEADQTCKTIVDKAQLEVKRELVELRVNVHRVTEEKEELEEQIRNHKEQTTSIDELEAKLADAERRCDEHKTQANDSQPAKEEIRALRAGLEEAEQRYTESKVLLEKGQQAKEEAEKEAKELQIRLDKVEQLCAERDQQIKDSEQAMASVKELQTTLKEAEERSAENEKLIEEGKQSQVEVQALQTKLNETERRCAESDAKAEKLQGDYKVLLSKLGPAMEAMKKKEELAAKLQKEHEEMTAQWKQSQQAMKETGERFVHVQQTLIETEAELARAQEDLNECRVVTQDELDECKHALAQKERENDELKRNYDEMLQENEGYEFTVHDLKARCEGLDAQVATLSSELEKLHAKAKETTQQMEEDRLRAENLQSVLEEFEATKEAEIRAMIEDYDKQLTATRVACANYKERAETAETDLENLHQDASTTEHLKKEVKEKNLLVGKLRHEAIILNEHLVEAMRRLKEESNESNVDRQLITNLLVGFLSTPRGDRRRYDILTIMAKVLQLTDEQMEQIGMIRSGQRSTTPSSPGWQSPKRVPDAEDPPKASFTDAWISFLLKESSTHKTPPTASSSAQPSSPHAQHEV